MKLTYGSVCSGIEAATVAWEKLGWKAAWLSEIEKFPSQVLAHHYPDVENLGDMTQIKHYIDMDEVVAPDVLVGGTPCQAFSLAGLRNSMDDERGQLTLAYVHLADVIDRKREEHGKEPAIIVWENVPGVLNTKDNAFGCFIAALSGSDEELHPPTNKRGKRLKWPDAGCVIGPKRTVAWRILDAQYIGLAQRRRRVFAVASAREDFHPAQVLFEFDGVRRDSPPSRETGQEVTPTIRSGSPNGSAGHGQRSGDSRDELIVPVARCITTREGQCFDPETTTMIAFNSNAMVDQMQFNEHTSAALTCSQQLAAFMPYRTFAKDGKVDSAFAHRDICDALHTSSGGGNKAPIAVSSCRVRRLTPRECERLQGFPDDYTLIPLHLNKPTDVRKFSADGPRYKALGNSMAVPVMRWLGRRIEFALLRPWDNPEL